MAYKTGTVTDGGGNFANQNLLALIRQFAGGFGTVGTIGGTRTGTGTLTAIEASPTAVTETWTLTCTAAAANSGTFSVSGSVSGAQADATVGTPYSISKIAFTINDGATDFIVGDVFTLPVTESTNPTASRWEVLRYDTSLAIRELILKGKGYSGTEEIFIGFRSYESVGADYYNISLAGFSGYVPGNTFVTQPRYKEAALCAHNLNVGYWLCVSPQRIALGLKVGTPVYDPGYVGKMFPNARPDQYNYPMVVAGTLNGTPATRYSDTNRSTPFKGNRANLSLLPPASDTWLNPYAWPYAADALTGATQMRDTGGVYLPVPLILHNNGTTNWGELEGVCYISGFNNVVENTVTVGAKTYVVLQDVYRTDFTDYIALELA